MNKQPKSKNFPLTVKAGSSSVKIYRDDSKGTPYYVVAFHLGSKRQRLNFTDLDAAKNEAAAKAAQLSRGDIDATQLNGKDRLTYGRALDAIKAFDIPLDAAAIEYAEARKILKGHSLIESSRFYMKHHGQGIADLQNLVTGTGHAGQSSTGPRREILQTRTTYRPQQQQRTVAPAKGKGSIGTTYRPSKKRNPEDEIPLEEGIKDF